MRLELPRTFRSLRLLGLQWSTEDHDSQILEGLDQDMRYARRYMPSLECLGAWMHLRGHFAEADPTYRVDELVVASEGMPYIPFMTVGYGTPRIEGPPPSVWRAPFEYRAYRRAFEACSSLYPQP